MTHVPSSAHSRQRREPLPWRAPKTVQDDPQAPVRLLATPPRVR